MKTSSATLDLAVDELELSSDLGIQIPQREDWYLFVLRETTRKELPLIAYD